jgi:hypothetical protein
LVDQRQNGVADDIGFFRASKSTRDVGTSAISAASAGIAPRAPAGQRDLDLGIAESG